MNKDDAKRPLPPGWRWARLEEVCEFKYGEGLPERQRLPGGVPVYGSNGIVGYHTASITDGAAVIVGRKGSIGEVHYSPVPCWPIDTTYYIDAAGTKTDCELPWLYSVLKWLQLDILNKATGVPGLNREDAYRQLLPLPPPDEQRRIAARLSEQMTVVERTRRAALAQVEATRALPASFIRQVFDWEEAKTWPMTRVAAFADTHTGTTPPRGRSEYYGGKVPWVKTGELVDEVIYDTEEHVTETALQHSSLKLLPPGTVLVAMIGQGQTRGRTGILAVPATTNQNCFAVLPNPAAFDPPYLQLWFRHNYLLLRRESEARGGSQPALNAEMLRNREVPLPGVEIQKRTVARLSRQMYEAKMLSARAEAQLEAVNALPGVLLEGVFGGFEPPS